MNPSQGHNLTHCSAHARRPFCGAPCRTSKELVENAGLRSVTHYTASTSQSTASAVWYFKKQAACTARRRVVSKALFDPPPFQPEKLAVLLAAGTTVFEPAPPLSRKYTLTHNDITGNLRLTIGPDYNEEQISGFYTRLLRDEVVAEWVKVGASGYALHVYCHVSGEERWLAPPLLRNYIFRREMPLVLDTLVYADRQLLKAQPELAQAQVYVHFQSSVKELDTVEYWGVLGDRSSWPKGPTSILLRMIYAVVGWPPSLAALPADLSVDLPSELQDVEEAVRQQQERRRELQQLEKQSQLAQRQEQADEAERQRAAVQQQQQQQQSWNAEAGSYAVQHSGAATDLLCEGVESGSGSGRAAVEGLWVSEAAELTGASAASTVILAADRTPSESQVWRRPSTGTRDDGQALPGVRTGQRAPTDGDAEAAGEGPVMASRAALLGGMGGDGVDKGDVIPGEASSRSGAAADQMAVGEVAVPASSSGNRSTQASYATSNGCSGVRSGTVVEGPGGSAGYSLEQARRVGGADSDQPRPSPQWTSRPAVGPPNLPTTVFVEEAVVSSVAATVSAARMPAVVVTAAFDAAALAAAAGATEQACSGGPGCGCGGGVSAAAVVPAMEQLSQPPRAVAAASANGAVASSTPELASRAVQLERERGLELVVARSGCRTPSSSSSG